MAASFGANTVEEEGAPRSRTRSHVRVSNITTCKILGLLAARDTRITLHGRQYVSAIARSAQKEVYAIVANDVAKLSNRTVLRDVLNEYSGTFENDL
jgi:hypothetical protein